MPKLVGFGIVILDRKLLFDGLGSSSDCDHHRTILTAPLGLKMYRYGGDLYLRRWGGIGNDLPYILTLLNWSRLYHRLFNCDGCCRLLHHSLALCHGGLCYHFWWCIFTIATMIHVIAYGDKPGWGTDQGHGRVTGDADVSGRLGLRISGNLAIGGYTSRETQDRYDDKNDQKKPIVKIHTDHRVIFS